MFTVEMLSLISTLRDVSLGLATTTFGSLELT